MSTVKSEKRSLETPNAMDHIARKQCLLCGPIDQTTAAPSCPTTLCCHMVDPEGRLFYQLTAMKKWTFDRARDAIQAYSEFLTLKIVKEDYDATQLSPTDMIDQVWHAHVLDTKAYQSFNTNYLVGGNCVHHDPLNAMDQTARQERCKNTIKAYESYFQRSFPDKSDFWLYDFYVGKVLLTVEYPVSG